MESERSIEEVLANGANLLFGRPKNAIEALRKGEKPKEAATALFWYAYRFSKGIDIDRYKTVPNEIKTRESNDRDKIKNIESLLKDIEIPADFGRRIDEREDKEAPNGKTKEDIHQRLTAIISDLVAFRNNFSWSPIQAPGNNALNEYVQIMTGAARIVMMLRKSVECNDDIQYTPIITRLITVTYETASRGIIETQNWSTEESHVGNQVFGEDVFGFSAHVACGIVYAAYAHMVKVQQVVYETAFLAYVEAFKFLHRADSKWECFSKLYNEGVFHLAESLYVYDKLIKQPQGVKDWRSISKAFGEFDNILFELGLEDDIIDDSGIDEGAPGDWYFPEQIKLSQALAERAKWEKTLDNRQGPFCKEEPFSNVLKLRRILKECQEYIWWADPYFQKEALEELLKVDPSRIHEIRILSRADEVEKHPDIRKEFGRFRKEMKSKGIGTEWRATKETHDRFIIGANIAYNMPPARNIFEGGGYAESNETSIRPPFEKWWGRSSPIL